MLKSVMGLKKVTGLPHVMESTSVIGLLKAMDVDWPEAVVVAIPTPFWYWLMTWGCRC
jgi:hypothetical protein